MYVAGKSGNEQGRPNGVKSRHSAITIKGRLERFLKCRLTITQLNSWFDQLPAKDKLETLMQIMPYVLGKVSSEGLSKEEAQAILDKVEQKIKQQEHGKAV